VHDKFSALAFAYDNRDRVVSVDNAGTPNAPHVVLKYAYDRPMGDLLSVTDTIDGQAGAMTSYQYDDLHRMTRITQTAAGVLPVADKRVDFGYNELGQFASIDRFSDLAGTQSVVSSSYSYDAQNRLTRIAHNNTAGTVDFFDYQYDAASRI